MVLTSTFVCRGRGATVGHRAHDVWTTEDRGGGGGEVGTPWDSHHTGLARDVPDPGTHSLGWGLARGTTHGPTPAQVLHAPPHSAML